MSFNDHYLEVDYDLSDVMFVTTANTTHIPRPLLDRMEVIRISGYTEDEKIRIATDHLIAKQYQAHGLKEGEWSITEGALRDLIRYYTREAGVRNLEREVANLQRKAVKKIVAGDAQKVKVTSRNLEKFSGVRRFRYGEVEFDDMVGITNGLAYTDTGGELLSIEAVVLPGRGKMTITGKLGDVMQESVQAARSYLRSRSPEFGLKPTIFEKRDIHVHVPEGATPKDGPSAGIAMFTSMLSALTGIPVRRTVAMTGEITLRGRVLPIGGLKEKLLAAHRSGIETVLIPRENEKDLKEIPDNVKRGLKVVSRVIGRRSRSLRALRTADTRWNGPMRIWRPWTRYRRGMSPIQETWSSTEPHAPEREKGARCSAPRCSRNRVRLGRFADLRGTVKAGGVRICRIGADATGTGEFPG